MPRRRFKPEELVAKLRQVDVLVSQGASLADAILCVPKTSSAAIQ
jgi:putative transposase